MFNATSYSAVEPGITLGHGLLGRGSRVLTRHSDAAGENQSIHNSIKLPQIFNQPVKNRFRPDDSWHVTSRDRQGLDSNHLITP